MLRSWRVWAGFALSLLFIALFFRGYDIEELWHELQAADYVYLIPALAVYTGALVLRAIRWQVLLNPLQRLSLPIVGAVMMVGYLANNLLPVRTGEVVRAYIIGERTGISKMATISTILLERLFDVMTLSIFLVLGALFVGVDSQVRALIIVMLVILVLGVAFLGFIAASRNRAHAFGVLLVRLLPGRFHDRGERLVGTFLDGFDSIRSGRALLAAFLLTVGTWAGEAATYYIVSLGFDLNVDFGTFLLVTAAANLAISVPSSQAGVGPFEFFGRSTLVFAGVTESAAAAFIVTVHAVLIIVSTLAGVVALGLTSVTLADVFRRKPSINAEGS